MNVVCVQCGKELHKDNLFCPYCGADAPRSTRKGNPEPENIADPQYCPLCGHPCQKGSSFCTSCSHDYFKKPENDLPVYCPECGAKNSNRAQICYGCSFSLSNWFLQKGEAAQRFGQALPFILRETMNEVSYYFSTADKISIGRASDNDICIPCSFISGHHLEIDMENKRLIDLSSTNGTYINRKPEKINKVPLEIVNEFNLAGNFTFSIVRNDAFFAIQLTAILEEDNCRRNGDGNVFDLLRKTYHLIAKNNGKILIGKTNGKLALKPKVEEIYWELENADEYIYLSDPNRGVYKQLVKKQGDGLAANWRVEGIN
ncbi:MAG: FHA domain-containing protein [Spirochaetaceae bacterium]|nr:FHA domain-containing protein [Spirochaetaceae bacterium]